MMIQNYTDSKSCKGPLMTAGAPGAGFNSNCEVAPPEVQKGHAYL